MDRLSNPAHIYIKGAFELSERIKDIMRPFVQQAYGPIS